MKTLFATALGLALALGGAAARAEEKPASGFGAFFSNMRKALDVSAVSGERKKARNAATVAAVRGKEQASDDPNEPLVKGDASSGKAALAAKADAELLRLVDLAEKGSYAEAMAGLQVYRKKFPKFHKEDVEKAIAMVKEKLGGEAAAAATAAPEPAAPAPAPAAAPASAPAAAPAPAPAAEPAKN